MQGAGHQFGIVTSFELKIHPKKLDTWHYHNYVFTQDKLEPFFKALNTFHNNGSTPVLMALNMGGFAMIPEISETEVCIFCIIRFYVFSCIHINSTDRPSSHGLSAIPDPPTTQKHFSHRSMRSVRYPSRWTISHTQRWLRRWEQVKTSPFAPATAHTSSQHRVCERGM
jgi:hypothetical protein